MKPKSNILLILPYVIYLIGVLNGQSEIQSYSTDTYQQRIERNRTIVQEFIAETKLENDSLLRYMIYLKRIIEINKYLINEKNWPEMVSSIPVELTSDEEKKEALKQIEQNLPKQNLMDLNNRLRVAILDEMRLEIKKIDIKYQKHFEMVLDEVRNKY